MRKQLEDLQLEDFDTFPMWIDLYGDNDELEGQVEPMMDQFELSSELKQHVWCRVKVGLQDGTELNGIGMYFCDTGQIGNFSIKIGQTWIRLILPPAPEFVLEKEGPATFSQRLGKSLGEVFPMIIETDTIDSKTRRKIKLAIEK
jgi:hypothetical protein